MATTTISPGTLPSIDPATGEVHSHIEKTSPSRLPVIIAGARRAQTVWAATPVPRRAALLKRLRKEILSSRNVLADAIVRESGKPRTEALFSDIFIALDTAEYFCSNAVRLLLSEKVPHHSLAAKSKSGSLAYEPLGVIGIISSWNYPLAIPISQIIPALAAGNAVVCKTSDLTPQCGALIEKLFADAGFPVDLVTIVQGGSDVGQSMIDAGPDKIFFTGSVETGRLVAQGCASRLIPTVLELGGKDAMLVLSDANLHNASSGAVWGSFTNCGQVCLSIERIFVDQSISEEFAALCAEKTRKLRLGPGCDPTTDVGPLIRPHQVQRMQTLVEDAVSRGAEVLCGGHPRPDLGENFFEPTVIVDVDSSARLFQEETFGPILAMQTVANAEEAIARANDSPFALSASVWTGNATHAKSVASQLRAGAVMVNDAVSYFAIAEAPHGGSRHSGWGRTHGKAGLREMVQTKYIDVERLPSREKPWWFRYGQSAEQSADAFLEFEYAGSLFTRLRNSRSALKTIFRKHGL
jgi:acyl-CoA reductase-like NAD-dependent aldehyde dehydrogenase